jgi:probable HAF family extracellular repeat protein
MTRNSYRHAACVAGTFFGAGVVFGQAEQGSFFRGLGFLDAKGRASAAMCVTPDGLYVGGMCDNEAVRWSESGPQSLGRLPAPYDWLTVAYAISADGSMIVGAGRGSAQAAPFRAFVWNAAAGITPLGEAPSPGSSFGSYAAGISADGSVVVGASDSGPGYPRAFVASPGRLWGAITDEPSSASAVSTDGRVVVGLVNIKGVSFPFSWTDGEGLALLGDLPGGWTEGIAYGVNADGTVIVGGSVSENSDPEDAYEAFRWTAATGMIALGDLPTGAYSSEARGVSADGSVVVGSSGVHPAPKTAAFIWDAVHGMRDLHAVLLNDYGLEVGAWELTIAQAVSADGRTIVGRGVNPEGRSEAWIAYMGRRCAADWNADGVLNYSDFLAFLDAFFCEGDDTSCPSADFNADGAENSTDFFDFLLEFFGGCQS